MRSGVVHGAWAQRGLAAAAALTWVLAGAPAQAAVPAGGVLGAGLPRSGVFVDCDSYDAMSAIGSQDQVVGGQAYAGTVRVRHTGGTQPPQTLDAASVGLPVVAGGRFGQSAVTAKINSDSCTDVVIGVPNAVGGVGRVVVVPGSGDGLALDKVLILDPGPAGIVAGDELGWAVTATASGGGTIIAAGAPNHNVGGKPAAGAIVTWFIPTGGVPGSIPAPSAPTLWTQGGAGLLGKPDPDDRFGSVLAAPFQSGSGQITVGIPAEDIGTKVDAGALATLTFTGPNLTGNSMVWQGSGMPGTSKAGDRFGAAVVADGLGIQGVGIPGKDANGKRDSGAVIVRKPSGGYKVITQNTKAVPDKSERYDGFGSALGRLFGLRGTEVVTLAVGVPGEDLKGKLNVGAVTFIDIEEVLKLTYGSQKAPGLPKQGRFGYSIVVVPGNFDNDEDRVDSLFIGAPGQSSLAPGTYYQGRPTGIQVWESGVYFAP